MTDIATTPVESEAAQLLEMRLPQVRVACVFIAAAVAVLAATALGGVAFQTWSMLPANFLVAAGLLAIARGCWQSKKWAWWVGVVLSGLWGALGLIMIPALMQMVPALIKSGVPGGASTGFMYLTITLPFLMLVACVLLLVKGCRKEFGIGRK